MEDVQKRLDRIYAAIGEVASRDPAKMRPSVTYHPGRIAISFDGGLSGAQATNAAMNAIHAVANLKDNLMSWGGRNGRNPDDVTELVKASRSIQIVMDLSNLDKHGPPRRGEKGWSGLRPSLGPVRRALRMQPSPPGEERSMSFVVDFTKGLPFQGGEIVGDAEIVIAGNVIGGDGETLGDSHVILTEALSQFESLLEAWNVRRP